LIEFLAAELETGDVCISMGCGDVASLPSEVLARLAERARTG
jgi:UDP-N-acetylmuramate-alanine ligase